MRADEQTGQAKSPGPVRPTYALGISYNVVISALASPLFDLAGCQLLPILPPPHYHDECGDENASSDLKR